MGRTDRRTDRRTDIVTRDKNGNRCFRRFLASIFFFNPSGYPHSILQIATSQDVVVKGCVVSFALVFLNSCLNATNSTVGAASYHRTESSPPGTRSQTPYAQLWTIRAREVHICNGHIVICKKTTKISVLV